MSHTTISIPKTTKARAQKMAQKYDMTVSAVAKMLLNNFSDGKLEIGIRESLTENDLTPQKESEILETSKKVRAGVDVEGPFNSMSEMIESLNKVK